MREKKGRVNFVNLVTRYFYTATVLTKERIRKFAARARSFICTYYYLEQETDRDDIGGENVHGFTPAAKQQLL